MLEQAKATETKEQTYGEAVAVLVAALATSKEPGIVAALATIAKGRTRGPRKENPFLAMFAKVGDRVHEDAVYKALKLGRKDAYWTIADAIKEGDVNARKWVYFTETDGYYTLMGVGPKPPEGYKGYVPKAER